ncbi:MAG: hypothetical protein HC852_17065 [Acaryochloridaceae cyanobacterium RU_4_10]|nr:hypothetical protein [Acaryochloridaceae cyanobacterium RU_4_10]
MTPLIYQGINTIAKRFSLDVWARTDLFDRVQAGHENDVITDDEMALSIALEKRFLGSRWHKEGCDRLANALPE